MEGSKEPTLRSGASLVSEHSWSATIYVGLKHRETGTILDRALAIEAIQEYVDAVGLCVSATDTEFRYTNGCEPGIAVGLINYPRFPCDPDRLSEHAIRLADALMVACRQMVVTVVMPGTTLMLKRESA